MVIYANLSEQIRQFLESLLKDILLSICIKECLAIEKENSLRRLKDALTCAIYNSFRKGHLIAQARKNRNKIGMSFLFFLGTENFISWLRVELIRGYG